MPEAVLRVSTSAWNGAMRGGVVVVMLNGVVEENDELKVTLPLLLMNRPVWVVPKKLTENGSVILLDDPSSARPRERARHPRSWTMALAGVTTSSWGSGSAPVVVGTR